MKTIITFKHDLIFLAGLTLWAIETYHFGFNMTAQSGKEHLLDIVASALMIYGFVGESAKSLTKSVHVHLNESHEFNLRAGQKDMCLGQLKSAKTIGSYVYVSDIIPQK